MVSNGFVVDYIVGSNACVVDGVFGSCALDWRSITLDDEFGRVHVIDTLPLYALDMQLDLAIDQVLAAMRGREFAAAQLVRTYPR